jgi:ATP-binding cassette, subfamily G (WHITE), member 2, SNQ2
MGYGQGSEGLNGTGFQLLIILFMLLFGVTLGQMVAALSPSVQVNTRRLVPLNLTYILTMAPHMKVAVLFNPFIALVLATFCGVTIPYPTMMKFWRSWLYELNPYTRTLAAMVSTELQ